MADLEECSRDEVTEIVEQLQDDLCNYKEHVGQQAQMNQRITTLGDENERLTECIAKLEAQIDPDPMERSTMQ